MCRTCDREKFIALFSSRYSICGLCPARTWRGTTRDVPSSLVPILGEWACTPKRGKWPRFLSSRIRVPIRVTPKPSVDTLIQKPRSPSSEGRRADARALFERALYSLKRAQDGQLATSILRWVARTYQLDGNADAALDCLDASIAVRGARRRHRAQSGRR